MDDGRPDDPDDTAGLEAVWGREASATAPPAPRPDLAAILGPPPADEPPVAPPPRRGRGRDRGRLAVGVVLGVVAVVVAALVLLGGGDDEQPEDRADPTTTTTEPPEAELAEPVWRETISCLQARSSDGTAACPVVVDDERAYVLTDRGGAATVEARALGNGALAWEVDLPEGAISLRRLPSTLLVAGVGTGSLTLSVDPATGTERWRAPGSIVGPVGPGHVLLDELVGAELEERGAMSVLDAVTGDVVLTREGTPAGLYVHPCGEAGLALVRQDGRLTAVGVPDGVERWSVPVTEVLDSFHRVHCDAGTAAFVDAGTLRLLDVATGAEIGATEVAPPESEGRATVVGVVAGTVVVGSSDGPRGFRADAGLRQLWRERCPDGCDADLPVTAAGPTGEDVLVVIGDRAVVRSGADGSTGPALDLGRDVVAELADGVLVARDENGVVVADPADLGRPVVLDRDGVRVATATATRLVVTTDDLVVAYPLEG
jgi:outer membrane protein assembly factor BamB